MIDRTVILFGVGAFVVALGGMQFASGIVETPVEASPDAETAAPQTEAPAPPPPPEPMAEHLGGVTANGELRLNRQDDGHFHAQIEVGGVAILVLVDTGATVLALTDSDAARAGIRPPDSAFNQRVATAGGWQLVAPVTIDRLRLGNHELSGVQAVVMRGDTMGRSLLGQSVLNRMNSITIEGAEMRLR